MKTHKTRLTQIKGNVAYAGREATAWYRLPGQRWSWRSEADRDALVILAAQRYSELINHTLHLRVTTRPSTAAQWRDRLSASTPDALPGWATHLDRCVKRLEHLNLTLAEKQVFVGVDLARTRSRFGAVTALWKHDDVDDIDSAMSGPGFDGRAATGDEIEWLLRSSVLLGHTPTRTSGFDAPWEETDLPEIVGDRLPWDAEPYQRSVKVTHEGVERFVVTSVIGRSQTLDSNSPWLCVADGAGFPVEISATINVLPPAKVLTFVQDVLNKIEAQADHFREHNRTAALPFKQHDAQERALEIQDEISRGRNELSTRVEGWYRLAVSGATEKEALARADQVRRLYAPQITVHRPAGQYYMAREFIPGESLSNRPHVRQMPVTTAAGAMPTVTTAVGHDHGFYLGATSGAVRPQATFLDLWRSTEKRERSGLAVLVGGLGSGKSSVLGLLSYQAALSGVPVTILDPSGPLAALCDVPELKDRSRHIDLLRARAGQLNPWRVIPDPVRAHYDSDAEYRQEVAGVNGDRQTLATDAILMMLPPQIALHEDTLIVLQRAAQIVSNGPDPSIRALLDILRSIARNPDEDPTMVRRCRILVGTYPGEGMLGGLAQLPAARLIFDSGDARLDADDAADPLLTVITMLGLQLPKEGTPREQWTTDERLGVALLHLSAWLVQRSVYRGDRNRRKLVAYDEAWMLALVGSGRALLNRSIRDSRKFNTRVLLASQNAADLVWQPAGEGRPSSISNLIDAVFVGHTEALDAQKEALRLLHVPEDCGYEEALATLNPHARGATGRSGHRDFVVNDGEGGIERVRIDLSQLSPAARAALDTTADPTKARVPVG